MKSDEQHPGLNRARPRPRPPPTTTPRASQSGCTLTPELTEGPYYFDVDKIRSDIREDREGVPLTLSIPGPRCGDLLAARERGRGHLDCDAAGSYYGSQEGPYLRGAQVTNARRASPSSPRSTRAGTRAGRCTSTPRRTSTSSTVLTTQLFFDDDLSAQVYERGAVRRAAPGATPSTTPTASSTKRWVLEVERDGDGYLGTISFDVASA